MVGVRSRRRRGEGKSNARCESVAPAKSLRRSFGDDPAGADDGDPISEVLRLIHVVRGEKNGLSQPPQTLDHLPRVAPSRRVEACGRLVEEDQLRVPNQGEGHVEAPELATREMLGKGAGLLLEADEGDRLSTSRSEV